jgi:hypothetical protein
MMQPTKGAALRCAQRAERAVEPAHPCLMRDAFGLNCSCVYRKPKPERNDDEARQGSGVM